MQEYVDNVPSTIYLGGPKRCELQLVQSDFTHEFVSDLQRLSEKAFGKTKRDYIQWRIEQMPDVTVFVASRNKTLVGF